MNHFDEMTALLYLEGQLDAPHAQDVKGHAATCAACRELLRALEHEGVWLRQALGEEEESVPARLLEAPSGGRLPWGWIAVLGFGAGGAYTLWSSVVAPWQAQAAQAGFTQGNVLTMLFFSGAFWKGWDAMRTLTEFLALATLGTLVMWLLRRHWRRLTTVAVLMTGAVAALAIAPGARAAENRRGDPNYTLPAGQEVKTDLIVHANVTRIDGDVDGDLIVFNQALTINGHVKGDVIAFAREVRLNGTVDGSVRAFANTVWLEGTIGRNVMSWTSNLTLSEKGKVGGTVAMFCEDGVLSGQVGNDVMGFADSMEVNGTLGRNVRVKASRLRIGSSAEIKGWTKYEGNHEPEVAAGAKLGSPVEFKLAKHGPDYANPRFYWHRVLLWGVGFIFGLVFMLLMPSFYADATQACKKYGTAGGFGFLFLVATPVAAIIACCTIVGLGVGIATLLLYIIAVYTSTLFVAGYLGEWLLGAAPGLGAAIGRLALGLMILHVLRVLPYVGGWILAVAVIWGLGAMVLAIYKRLKPTLAATTA
jgi:cytoskeletal protein CcmA (bactofilin family)